MSSQPSQWETSISILGEEQRQPRIVFRGLTTNIIKIDVRKHQPLSKERKRDHDLSRTINITGMKKIRVNVRGRGRRRSGMMTRARIYLYAREYIIILLRLPRARAN